MTIWMCLVLIGIVGLMNIVCFYIGAKIGQKVVNKEPLEVKTPVEMVKDYVEQKEIKREQKEEQDIIDTIQHNIDIYDGTALGQKEIPR